MIGEFCGRLRCMRSFCTTGMQAKSFPKSVTFLHGHYSVNGTNVSHFFFFNYWMSTSFMFAATKYTSLLILASPYYLSEFIRWSAVYNSSVTSFSTVQKHWQQFFLHAFVLPFPNVPNIHFLNEFALLYGPCPQYSSLIHHAVPSSNQFFLSRDF